MNSSEATTTEESETTEAAAKWTCEQCTYENWPSSLKCTICHFKRAAKVPPPSTPTTSDIYKLSELVITHDTSPRPQPKSEAQSKWSCAQCTYQNWPKSKKCVQCHQPRSGVSSTHSSRRSSPTNATHGDRGAKWTCRTCTYQNWPKSQRCVMCNATRTSIDENRKSPVNGTGTVGAGTVDDSLDRLFLLACQGVVDNDLTHINTYLNMGGDATRYLTAEEVALLNRPHVFFVGLTLLHLCYQFKRNECLVKLIANSKRRLIQQPNSSAWVRRYLPCQSCPSLASNITDRYLTASLRQRKLDNQHGANSSTLATSVSGGATGGASAASPDHNSAFHYVNECFTFLLPAEIEAEFSSSVQRMLFDELLDRDVEYELEVENTIVNWNADLVKRLGSRLYPLWNRRSGDCLLDSVLQACYGVFDSDNILRRLMAECMDVHAASLKPRWKEHEVVMARALGYTIDDVQLEQDWANVMALAHAPGSSLEQAHIFALAHIFRRPVIVYGVKYVKSFRGENIGYSHFEGVYLPLLWDPSFCFKNPIVLGYTRGHFTALVAMEHVNSVVVNDCSGGCSGGSGAAGESCFYLPLSNADGQLLPVHFLSQAEVGLVFWKN